MIEQGYIKLYIAITTELNTDNASKVVEQLEQPDNEASYVELVKFYEKKQLDKTASFVHSHWLRYLAKQQNQEI